MKFLITIIILMMVAPLCYGVDVPEEWLREVRDHIKALQEQVDSLTKALNNAESENLSLNSQIYALKNDLNAQTGLYYGGLVNYPFPSIHGVIMYKFKRWGLMANMGYSDRFTIGAGVMFKAK